MSLKFPVNRTELWI